MPLLQLYFKIGDTEQLNPLYLQSVTDMLGADNVEYTNIQVFTFIFLNVSTLAVFRNVKRN